MERVNGYICIDEYKKELINDVKGQYWVYMEGSEYFYKPVTYPYRELIAYYAAKMIGIESCFYDLAVLDNEIGYISKSLREDNVRLVSGQEILNDYLKGKRAINGRLIKNIDVINDMGVIEIYDECDSAYLSLEYLESDDINNLEIIWQALEYRYKDKINISKVMEQFVLMYMFTIIFKDVDKHPSNWMIIEKGNDIRLAPIFDNEFILNDYYSGISLSVNFSDYNFDVSDSLLNFFKLSSKEFFDIFVEKFEMLENSLEMIIRFVEKQIGVKIPDYDKECMRMMFDDNCSYIRYVLDGFKTKNR